MRPGQSSQHAIASTYTSRGPRVMCPSPRYRPSRYAYDDSFMDRAWHRGHEILRAAVNPDATRRRPARQCRMAAIDTPQIRAFSLSRMPIADRRRAVSTVACGYMTLSSHMPPIFPLNYCRRILAATSIQITDRSSVAKVFCCAGSGIRTRTPFRADAFETSMSAVPSSRHDLQHCSPESKQKLPQTRMRLIYLMTVRSWA